MRLYVQFVIWCWFGILSLALCNAAIAKNNTKPDLSEAPMTVVIVRDSSAECEPLCPQWISAEGRITSGSPALFKKTLSQLGKAKLPILLQSGGGDVRAALEIGKMIRKKNLDVAIGWTLFRGDCKPGQKDCKLPKQQNGVYRGMAFQARSYCNSACPLLLASGVNRYVSSASYVGVHQILNIWQQGDRITYRERYLMVHGRKHVISRTIVSRVKGKSYTTNGLTKELRKQLTTYLNQMGVDPVLLLDMDKAPPTSIYWMPVPQLEKTKLVTSATAFNDLEARRVCKLNQFAPVCVLNFKF